MRSYGRSLEVIWFTITQVIFKLAGWGCSATGTVDVTSSEAMDACNRRCLPDIGGYDMVSVMDVRWSREAK